MRLRRCEAGANAVEFALVVPMLLALIFGIFEFGEAVWIQGMLDYAVEQAARCASVNSATCGSTSATATFASQQTSPLNIPAADFTVTAPPTSSCGNKVVASYVFDFIGSFPLIGGSAIFPTSVTLTSTSCYPT